MRAPRLKGRQSIRGTSQRLVKLEPGRQVKESEGRLEKGRAGSQRSHVKALGRHTSGVTMGVALNLPAVKERAIKRM